MPPVRADVARLEGDPRLAGWDHRKRARKRLAAVLRDPAFDVTDAALLVAWEEYPDLDPAQERDRFLPMGTEARRRLEGMTNPFERTDALRSYLFDEMGFHGNEDAYYDPRNSFLNEVLDRRTGIPITLSIIYMEIARVAGLEVRGVALPGHFVVRVDDDGRRLLIDPFRGGTVISEEDCRDLVARATGRPSLFRRDLLEGTSSRETFGRLLRNLKRVYLGREDYERALGVVDRLLLVLPREATELRDRGFLLAHLDRHGAAMNDLEAYLGLAPHAPDANAVRGRIAWLRRKIADVN